MAYALGRSKQTGSSEAWEALCETPQGHRAAEPLDISMVVNFKDPQVQDDWLLLITSLGW